MIWHNVKRTPAKYVVSHLHPTKTSLAWCCTDSAGLLKVPLVSGIKKLAADFIRDGEATVKQAAQHPVASFWFVHISLPACTCHCWLDAPYRSRRAPTEASSHKHMALVKLCQAFTQNPPVSKTHWRLKFSHAVSLLWSSKKKNANKCKFFGLKFQVL